METIIFFIMLIGIAGLMFFPNHIRNNYRLEKKKRMEDKLYSLEDFAPTQKIIGNDNKSCFAIDENRKKICLIRHNSDNVELEIMTYKDLLSSEIFEDGNTVIRTSRMSQLGGTLVGGLALGGIGAVIGGLSSKKISSNKVSRVDLRLTVNRTNSPIYDINFMNVESKKNDIIYINAMQQARHWHGLVEILIRRADEVDVMLIENKQKKCPVCAEKIKFEAIKCRYCEHKFDPTIVKEEISKFNIMTANEKLGQKEISVEVAPIIKNKIGSRPGSPDNSYACCDCDFVVDKDKFEESNLFCPHCGSTLTEYSSFVIPR